MPNDAIVTLDRKLWLTEDQDRLVEHEDPEARFLFGIAGRRVSAAECKRLKYRPNPKLAADDETAQTVASDAEKQAARELESLKTLAAEGDEDALTALAMLETDAKAARGKAKAKAKALKAAEEKAEKKRLAAADKAAKAAAAKEEKTVKAAAAKKAKEAKKIADKEAKKPANKGGK